MSRARGYYAHLRESISRILEDLDTEEAMEGDVAAGVDTDQVNTAIFHLQEARTALLRAELPSSSKGDG